MLFLIILQARQKRRLNRYLKSRTFDDGEKEYIIISIPIRTGQEGMVGILLSDFKKKCFCDETNSYPTSSKEK